MVEPGRERADGWSRSTVVAAERRPPTDDHARSDFDVDTARSRLHNAEPMYGRPPRRRPRSGGEWVREFVYRYGWRAYALPILFVVTVAALATTTKAATTKDTARQAPAGKATSSTPPLADGRIPLKQDEKGSNFSDEVPKAAALPAGGKYTAQGDDTFETLKGTSPKVGSGQLFRYSIDVEKGITGVDRAQFANLVVKTMADKRSWSGHGVAVQRVDSGPIDFHVTMTSTMTVRKYCGYDIPVETSCYAQAAASNGKLSVNRVFFNVARWVRGATAYLGDLNAYRVYMINHENGHALGHNHAHQCLPGGLAPLMMQQTFGLRSTKTGDLCQANPWPYPPGVKGTPGAEQPDTNANNEYGRGD